MEHSWRWFGCDDPISLEEVRQTGAKAVVSSLHHIPNGQVWPRSEIRKRKAAIEAAGVKWTVVESVPVHEHIKRGGPLRDEAIENYKTTLRNLAEEGLSVATYNFMPVLDWTRTDLAKPLPEGGTALAFDFAAYAAFDLYVLGRPSQGEYTKEETLQAQDFYESLSQSEIRSLEKTVLAGLPGSEETFTLASFREALAKYEGVDQARLRTNLHGFLDEVVPVAEECGIFLAAHPDDPARPLFGLPRVLSTEEDLRDLVSAHPSPANGLALCVASLASNPSNDLDAIVERFLPNTHFVHLRNIETGESGKSFVESGHLEGKVDMVGVIEKIKCEEARREREGEVQPEIPMRPDHGHSLLDDVSRKTRPGYSLIGRTLGLAALSGVERAVERLIEKRV